MVNQLHTKAAIASHAMEEVWTKSLSHTTQVAERAMIDTPEDTILEEEEY